MRSWLRWPDRNGRAMGAELSELSIIPDGGMLVR